MTERDDRKISKRIGRRIGYGVAIACNVALLVVTNNLLDWGWLPWLTSDLTRALPFLNASLIASTAANACYLAYDPPWFKSVAEIGLLVVSLLATIRLLQVFPFDFSAYEFGWATLARWILGAVVFFTCVALVVQVIRSVRLAAAAG